MTFEIRHTHTTFFLIPASRLIFQGPNVVDTLPGKLHPLRKWTKWKHEIHNEPSNQICLLAVTSPLCSTSPVGGRSPSSFKIMHGRDDSLYPSFSIKSVWNNQKHMVIKEFIWTEDFPPHPHVTSTLRWLVNFAVYLLKFAPPQECAWCVDSPYSAAGTVTESGFPADQTPFSNDAAILAPLTVISVPRFILAIKDNLCLRDPCENKWIRWWMDRWTDGWFVF